MKTVGVKAVDDTFKVSLRQGVSEAYVQYAPLRPLQLIQTLSTESNQRCNSTVLKNWRMITGFGDSEALALFVFSMTTNQISIIKSNRNESVRFLVLVSAEKFGEPTERCANKTRIGKG